MHISVASAPGLGCFFYGVLLDKKMIFATVINQLTKIITIKMNRLSQIIKKIPKQAHRRTKIQLSTFVD